MRSPPSRWVAPVRWETPSITNRRSGCSSMRAPMRWRRRASSTTSGSTAAFSRMVRPSATAAVMSTVSVAPTLGKGRAKWAPWRRRALASSPSSVSSTSAPNWRSACTWKSTGRDPMRSPPTRGTNASPMRCSSGPTMRIGTRLRPV